MDIGRILLTAAGLTVALHGHAQIVFNPEWPRVGPFSAADMCSNCHDASALGEIPAVMRAPHPDNPDQPDPSGHNISPMYGQKSGVMGHALDDPYFLAAVDDEVSYFPDNTAEIENECLRCHAPMAFDYAHGTGTDSLDADGYYRLDTAVSEMQAREGVSCTLCHQLQVDPEAELNNGARIIEDDSILFGPIADPVRTRMARYGVQYSEAISDSALCGTCHNLYTQVFDPISGLPSGGRFLEQAVWYEWRNSAFAEGEAVSCQQCHMAAPGESFQTPVATYQTPPARSGYSQHLNPGGNTQLLQMLKQFRLELGLDPRLTDGDFEVAILGTREILGQSAALALELDGRPGVLMADVTIQNLTGHKLPTGYPSRRMWLHLVVKDAAENTVFESGAVDAEGRLALDAAETLPSCTERVKPQDFDSTACYTPHHDVIDDESSVAVFESVMSDDDGIITYVLLSGRGYIKDNRIPPAGFTSDSPHYIPEMASVGTETDTDFNAAGSGRDSVHYRIDVVDDDGPFTVHATLYYQSVRPAFVSVLSADTQRVNDYRNYYSAVPPAPEILAQAALTAAIETVFMDGFEFTP